MKVRVCATLNFLFKNYYYYFLILKNIIFFERKKILVIAHPPKIKQPCVGPRLSIMLPCQFALCIVDALRGPKLNEFSPPRMCNNAF